MHNTAAQPGLSQRRALGVVAIAFFVSRLVYLTLLGVRFTVEPLDRFVQYLDPALLRTDLLRSVYYSHFQPPAFNLFLGAVLQAFPERFALAFQVIYLGLGLAFGIFLYLLMDAMGVRRSIAVALTVIHTLLPTTVMYENWLFYSYPVAVLLCASAWLLVRFVQTSGRFYGVMFFATIVAVSMIHAMYGALWVFAVLAGLLLLWKGHRTLIVACALVPMSVVIFLGAKQYVLFGTFTSGAAFAGPNLAHRLAEAGGISWEAQEALLESPDVPPYFFEHPLLPLEHFYEFLEPAGTGIEALDQERKSTGQPNFNNLHYIEVGGAYMHGAMKVMREHPGYYLNTFTPTSAYFNPAGEDLVETQRSPLFVAMARTANHWVSGQFEGAHAGWWLVITLPLLLADAMRRAVLEWKRGSDRGREGRAAFFALAYAVVTVAYTTGITVAVSWGDWARYRFGIDAFYLVFFGLALTSMRRWQAVPEERVRRPAMNAPDLAVTRS